MLPGMTKRGYSRQYPTQWKDRIKREIDRVPPTLDRRVRQKLARLQARGVNISLRSLTLTLWEQWVDAPDDDRP